MDTIITKSDFRLFLDAPRHLWAKKYGKLSNREIDSFLQHIFDQGYEVERLADRFVKEFLMVDYCVSEKEVLLQPTVTTKHFQARTDILIKNPKTDRWDMYEIKSSTSDKPLHRLDVTFQALVFQDTFTIGDVFILHLNSKYIRKGALDIGQLFKATNISDYVKKLSKKVEVLCRDALRVVQQEDCHETDECLKPKTCPCLDLCHPLLPEYSVYDIARIGGSYKKLRELVDTCGENIYDVPKDYTLTPAQRQHVDAVQTGQIYVDKSSIKKDLDGLTFPLHFIDYESYNPAIPLYDGYKPFDNMPFQYSLHILAKPEGKLAHFEFLETKTIDPILGLLRSLQSHLKKSGSIIVWNRQFEGSVNTRMAEIHPEFEKFCHDMNSRMYDLMDIFQNLWYLDPAFKGSYSLKAVLPALIPELSYKVMAIGDGATAMAEWKKLVYGKFKVKSEKQKIKKNLLEYCKMDTLATVRIYHELMRNVKFF